MSNNRSAVKEKRIGNRIQWILADDTTGAKLFLLAWCIFLCGETLSTTMFPVPDRLYMICKALPVLMVVIKVLLFDSYQVTKFLAFRFTGADWGGSPGFFRIYGTAFVDRYVAGSTGCTLEKNSSNIYIYCSQYSVSGFLRIFC